MKTSLIASTALLALIPLGAVAQDRTLTISVYAFAQDDFKTLVYDPFEKQCGCKLVVETGNSVERLAKMEANKANPVVDMAVVSMADALSASRKGLVEKIDPSKLTNFGKLYDLAKDPNGDGMSVGYTFYATSIAYRSDKMKIEFLGRSPQAGICGPRRLSERDHQPGAAGALYARPRARQGYARPQGTDRSRRRKKDDIVTFYEKSSQLIQLMQQEEIWAAPIGRFSWAGFTKLDLPVAWATPKEGQTGGMNVMVVTKGSKNQDLALQFMDFWLSTDIQTKLAEKLIDSPANKDVKVSEAAANNLTYGEDTAKSLKLIPSAAALDNRDAWLKEWNDKVGQ
ncbi:extracellular solute-binding protein [Rhizobium gallicum]|uniref:extracellular solute-binding protein n=1 Tax=Rhizobium gallicum TaxID=56730 RepID=UPI001EF7BBD9|nr:extracellular solute-binding protein [Rhizobium gallicum]ULJ72181.1 extracellular solute-binding protein [Rhizobium gallicum]